MPGSNLSRQRPPTQPPDHPHGFPDDMARHLALAFGPVDEDDRDLHDPEAALPRPEAELDLERVPVRANRVEVERGEHLAAEALEATGRVEQLKSRDDAGVDVRVVAQDETRDRPVHDGDLAVP